MIREKSDYRPEKKEDWMKKRRKEKNAAAKTRYRIFGLAADATCLCCLIDLVVAIGYSRERKSGERRRFWL